MPTKKPKQNTPAPTPPEPTAPAATPAHERTAEFMARLTVQRYHAARSHLLSALTNALKIGVGDITAHPHGLAPLDALAAFGSAAEEHWAELGTIAVLANALAPGTVEMPPKPE